MKTNKGFTLVELLVVIAIIAILSAIGIVSVGSARHKARIAATQGEMTALLKSVEICFTQEEDLNCGSGTWTEGGPLCTGQTWPSPEYAHPQGGCWSDSSGGYFVFGAILDDDNSTSVQCSDGSSCNIQYY